MNESKKISQNDGIKEKKENRKENQSGQERLSEKTGNKNPEKAGKERHPGPNQKLGKAGEDAACRYLEKQGYRILTRNFRARTGEIDIIAVETEKNVSQEPVGTLVFVEVKTRRNLSYGMPSLSVTRTKQKHLLMAAGLYRHLNGLYGIPVRYDVIEILSLEEKLYVRHIRNAFS